ncbi:MAG: long-chain N-acyl amino acid synthase [Pelomonas sp.]|nr:long-chain N-acyl amino acid synthase [Roseateles sp.]
MDVDVFNDVPTAAAGLALDSITDVAHRLEHAQAEAVGALVDRRYAGRGYKCTRLSALREDALTVCSASQGERVVGTIAVRFPSPRGFNAETCFAPELATLRAEGRVLCEFTRLAMDDEVRDNKRVLARLFHLAYLHGHRLGGCDMVVIEVNPRHVAFYRRMLGFTVRSDVRENPLVGAPAVLMSMDMHAGRSLIASLGGRPELASTTRMLYPFFYSAAEEETLLRRLKQ